jgi:hypothetical protein
LILGRTIFVGRAAATEAISLGNEVTTFSRGTKATPKEQKQLWVTALLLGNMPDWMA